MFGHFTALCMNGLTYQCEQKLIALSQFLRSDISSMPDFAKGFLDFFAPSNKLYQIKKVA